MAIKIENIKKKLDQFKASKQGKELIEKTQAEAIKSGKKLSPTLNSYKQLGDLFMKELSNTINNDGRSSDALKDIGRKMYSNKGNYYISAPELVKGRQYKIGITFDRENLQRKSLFIGGIKPYLGDGLDNILAFFNNGMDMKESTLKNLQDRWGLPAPFGLWETHNKDHTWATTHRDPLLFMQKTASIFKTKYKKDFNIKSVTISDEYKKQ